MRLSEFFLTYGPAAFRQLAVDAKASPSYLLRLAYTKDLPSMRLSIRLVNASNRRLTLSGLSDPVPIAEARAALAPNNSMVLEHSTLSV
jgi:hypothetical protein